jgi:hypothetical protein
MRQTPPHSRPELVKSYGPDGIVPIPRDIWNKRKWNLHASGHQIEENRKSEKLEKCAVNVRAIFYQRRHLHAIGHMKVHIGLGCSNIEDRIGVVWFLESRKRTCAGSSNGPIQKHFSFRLDSHRKSKTHLQRIHRRYPAPQRPPPVSVWKSLTRRKRSVRPKFLNAPILHRCFLRCHPKRPLHRLVAGEHSPRHPIPGRGHTFRSMDSAPGEPNRALG